MAIAQIEMRMNIMPGPNRGMVMVPGCEPTSALTSTRMDAEIRRHGLCSCSAAFVDDILEAIPGARVERMLNMGFYSGRDLLILPAVDITCPCAARPDYYAMIRGLCSQEAEDELAESNCDAFSIDPCQKRPEWRGQE